MARPAPTYDLVLLLDTEADPPVRSKIVADARGAIEAQGELLRHDEWGERALAYPIDHKVAAEYHLLQFHASTPELLGGLERSLKITDGVIRSRIVKLDPGTPEAPDMRPGTHHLATPDTPAPAPAPPETTPVATTPVDPALDPPAPPEAEPELTVGETA